MTYADRMYLAWLTFLLYRTLSPRRAQGDLVINLVEDAMFWFAVWATNWWFYG